MIHGIKKMNSILWVTHVKFIHEQCEAYMNHNFIRPSIKIWAQSFFNSTFHLK